MIKNEALAFEIIKDKDGRTWLDPEGVNIDKDEIVVTTYDLKDFIK